MIKIQKQCFFIIRVTILEAQVDQRGFLQAEIDAKSLVPELLRRWGSRLNHLRGRNPRVKPPHLAGPKLNSPKIFIFGKKSHELKFVVK